jgi:hypothetical protein
MVVLAVPLQSTTLCIPHLGVSCVGYNNSKIRAIAHNSNRDNFSSNSRSSSSNISTVLLLHSHNRNPPGLHNNTPLATFHASTMGRCATLLENAASPSKATHCDLWHPRSISRGATRRVLHHRWAAPTTPPWRRSPLEKKY